MASSFRRLSKSEIGRKENHQRRSPDSIELFKVIAKGYACDVIARLLEKEGVRHMVEIGGEVL